MRNFQIFEGEQKGKSEGGPRAQGKGLRYDKSTDRKGNQGPVTREWQEESQYRAYVPSVDVVDSSNF